MKKLLSALITASLLFSSAVVPVSAEDNSVNVVTSFPTSNLIVNGGFENGLEGWVTDDSGVFEVVENTFKNPSGTDLKVVNGTKAVKATVTNTVTKGYMYKEVDVTANTNYVLNLSWFHLANTKGSVKVYGDAISDENLLANVGNIFGGEVWYSSTATFNSGEHEKVIIKIDIFNPNPSQYSALYFCVDNITLKAAGNTQTIDFESGFPEDFNIRGKEFAVTTEKAYTGTHSIKLTSGNAYKLANATFALNPERHYAVMFWYYVESGSLGAASKFAHENGWSGYTTSPIARETLKETGEWKRAILTPNDAVSGTLTNKFVEIAFQNMATNTVVYIDNIQCKYYDESVDSITITGENELDGTLSADVVAYNYGYNFEDPVTYQWQRSSDKTNWVDISGAISEDYVLTEDDSDKYVRLKVNTSNRYSETTVDSYYSKAIKINEFVNADEVESVTSFPTSNIMVNGSFENGLEGWTTDGSDVFKVVENTFTTPSGSVFNVVNGTKALRADVTNTVKNGYIYQTVDVTANTNYVLNLSWFHLTNSKGSVKVYGDSMTEENLLANVGNIFGGEVWYSSTATFNSGEHEKVIIKIDIFNPNPSQYSALYFCVDNITLKAAGNTQTIGFESGIPEDFNIRNSTYAVSTEKAYEGTHSIKLTSGNAYQLANVAFALNKERHYAVMFWYYIESGSLGAVAKHAHQNSWADYTTSPIRAAQTLSDTGEWKRAILTPADGVTGSGNNSFIEMAFQNMSYNTVVYIDNIQCKYYDESVDSITITGENIGGGTLHADVNAYNYGYEFEDPVTYQWQRSSDKKVWTDIEGATEADYKLTMDDSQKFLRLKVNTSNRYSTSIVDSYYSKSIAIVEITIEDIKAQLLKDIDALVADFDETNYAGIISLATALELANEYECDITTLSKYEALQAIGLENLTTVKRSEVTTSGKNATVKLVLSAPISEVYVTDDNFKVLANRKAIDYTLATEKEGDKVASVNITFAKAEDVKYYQVYAKYGYACNYSDVLSIYDILVEDEIVLTNKSGQEINKLSDIKDGVLKGSVKLSAGSNQNVLLAQAIYDDEERLYSTAIAQDELEAGDSKNYEFTLSLPEDVTDAYSFKTFIWNAETLSPFTGVKGSGSLNKTYGLDTVNDPTKPLTVAFIGGSQTQGGYYTGPLEELWQKDREGEVTFINAGVGGSGTDYGVYRLRNDVISHNPDVVFVEFTYNDRDSDMTTVRRNVEGIIRQLRDSSHVPVIIFLYSPAQGNATTNMETSINNYNQVLNHYGLTAINVHDRFEELNDYSNLLQSDNVHLNSAGGSVYAEYVYAALKGDDKAKYFKTIANGTPLFANEFKNPTLISPTAACYDANWQDAEPDDKVTEGYEKPIEEKIFEHYMATNVEGATMTFTFVGDKLLLEGLRGPKGRKVQYKVTNEDGTVVAVGEAGNYVNVNNWYKGSYMLLQGLGAGKHTLKITVLADEGGAGKAFGIGGIWVDEQ